MSDSIAILSLLAVFVTLVINAIQTQTQVKQARLLTESNAVLLYQHMTEGMRDLSEIFVQYPKLRPVFYENEALPVDEVERKRALALAEIFVDFMGFTLNRGVFLTKESRSGYIKYFRHLAINSPAIQLYWMQRRDWYAPPVWAVLNDPVEQALRRSGDGDSTLGDGGPTAA